MLGYLLIGQTARPNVPNETEDYAFKNDNQHLSSTQNVPSYL